jgi:hypothetical protein
MSDSWDLVSGKWVDWSRRVEAKLQRLDQRASETDARLIAVSQSAITLYELRYQDKGLPVPEHLREPPSERPRVRVKAGVGRSW